MLMFGIKSLFNNLRSKSFASGSDYIATLFNAGNNTDLPNPKQNLEPYTDLYGKSWIVTACVNKIQSDISTLPFQIVDKKTRKEKSNTKINNFIELINKPNSYMGVEEFFAFTVSSMLLTGNAYFYKFGAKDDGTDPIELVPLMPQFVIPKFKDGKFSYYKYGNVAYRPEQILNFKTFSFNPIKGISPSFASRVIIDTLMKGERFNNDFYKNGAVLSGILSSENPIGEDTRKRNKANWDSMHSGEGKAFRTAVLDGGLKWQSMSMSNKDMDSVQISQDYKSSVLSSFGVTPVVLGIVDMPAQATVEAQERIYWENIRSRANGLVMKITNQLLEMYDNSVDMIFSYSHVQAFKRDVGEKATAQSQLMLNGYTRNESADVVGLDAPKDKTGDIRYPPSVAVPTFSGLSAPKQKLYIENKALTIAEIRQHQVDRQAFGAKYFKQLEVAVQEHFTNQGRQFANYINSFNTLPKSYDAIFDILEETKKLQALKAEVLEPVLNKAVVFELNYLGEFLNKSVTFYSRKQVTRVEKWIEQQAFQWAGLAEDTTRKEFDRILTNAQTEGLSTVEVEKQLNGYFKPEQIGYRVRAIAETEIFAGMVQSSLEAYDQEPAVNGKGWLHSGSELERDSHVEAGRRYGVGGEFVALNQQFEVAGYLVDAPKTFPVADENVYCKCDIFPKIGQ